MAIKKINTDLELEAKLIDANGSAGTSGQILSSTSTGIDWISLSEIAGVDGTGTANYITKWADSDTIGNSSLTNDNNLLRNLSVVVGYPTSGNGVELFNSTTAESILQAYNRNSSIWNDLLIRSNNIMFWANGSERMRINAAGNLLIGTTADISSSRREIVVRGANGSLLSLGNNTNADRFQIVSDSGENALINNKANTPMILYTNNVERMRISNTGDVGIGTSSPTAKLDVASIGSSANFGNSTFTDHWINIRNSASAGVQIGLNDSFNTGQGGMLLKTGDSKNFAIAVNKTVGFDTITESDVSFLISTSGNIGIGTSTIASSRLTISGGSLPTQDNGNTNALQFSGGVTGRRASSNTVGFIGTYLNTSSIEISAGLSGAGISMHGSSASSNANSLVLYTNSAESMRITSTGNVGIGTTAPGTKLDVVGTANTFASIGTTGASSGRALLFQDKKVTATKYNWLIGAQYNIDNAFEITPSTAIGGSTYSTPSVTILQSGNVGIGTSSPAQKLHVEGSAAVGTTGTEDILLLGRAISSGVSFQQAASLKLGRYQNAGGSYESYTRLDFALRDNSPSSNYNTNTTVMTLTNAGNVGIGTTSPSQKLTIGDGTATGNQYLRINGAGSDIYIGQSVGTLLGISPNSGGLIINDNAYPLGVGTILPQPLIFGTNNTERMRITSGGNVGIGTSNPITKLEVDGTVTISGPSAVKWKYSDNYAYFGIGYISGADYGFYNYNYARADLYIKQNSGNVGIGTTSPGAKLDVNGDALINQLTIGQGPVVGQGNTALGKGALGSMVGGKSNIAVGSNANSDNDVTGLTAIGVDLNTDTNLDPLGQNCLAISQFNANAYSDQVPHIYVPSAISVGSSSIEDIITFDVNHYVGAFIEYVITRSDGGDFAAGTVTVAWKDSGSGNLKDTRDVVWSSYMDDLEFLLSGTTVQLRNDSDQGARIRISVRAMIRT